MKHVALILIVLLATVTVVVGQEVSPPDKARIHSSGSSVTFQWPGTMKDSYSLQVYAGGRQMLDKTVRGNSTTLPLAPGPRYQWKVSKMSTSGPSTVGEYTFQLSSDLTFSFDGRDGNPGRPANDGRSQSMSIGSNEAAGQRGEDGQNGENGSQVTVTLETAGDYIAVTLQSNRTEKFLLPKDSAPFLVSTTGGHGGAGGRGGDGAAGFLGAGIGTGTQERFVFPGGAGGDGGSGGQGGAGGDVTITTRGVDGSKYVRIRNEGGLGGEGGGPGRGGPQPPVQFDQGVVIGPGPSSQNYIYSSASQPGRPGNPGAPGRAGQVLAR
jgi:hypothetical protein